MDELTNELQSKRESLRPKTAAFTVREFAKLSDTTRDALLHYDKIGLLSPAYREANNYRLYTHEQLASVNLINTCRKLGVRLKDAKRYAESRSPEQAMELLERQIGRIEDEVSHWGKAKMLLETLKKDIESTKDIDEDMISVTRLPAKTFILGPKNDYSAGRDTNDALLAFYHYFTENSPKVDLNYPVWGMFSEERIKREDYVWPDYYYFNNPQGSDIRRRGLFAIGYGRGNYGQTRALYERMFCWIRENGYEICGPAYEEYPLNEISVKDPNRYLIRSIIEVRSNIKNPNNSLFADL